jgi:hypothetical protein
MKRFSNILFRLALVSAACVPTSESNSATPEDSFSTTNAIVEVPTPEQLKRYSALVKPYKSDNLRILEVQWLTVIRVEAPEFCIDKAKCLSFVIFREEACCLYSTAFLGPYAAISDELFAIGGARAVSVYFGELKDGQLKEPTTVLFGDGWVAIAPSKF